jgi:hypothetical protein
VARAVNSGKIKLGAIHTYIELFARYFIDLRSGAERKCRHGSLRRDDNPFALPSSAFRRPGRRSTWVAYNRNSSVHSAKGSPFIKSLRFSQDLPSVAKTVPETEDDAVATVANQVVCNPRDRFRERPRDRSH